MQTVPLEKKEASTSESSYGIFSFHTSESESESESESSAMIKKDERSKRGRRPMVHLLNVLFNACDPCLFNSTTRNSSRFKTSVIHSITESGSIVIII